MLIEAGLPNCQYISCKNGMCGWQSDVECVIDARLFEELIGDAEKALSESEKLKLYTKAFNLYKGEFLPASSTEDWVTVESVRYKELYAGCVRALTGILDKNGDHKAALDVYTKAGAIYPYDEDFQIGKIDELVNLKSFREALSTFECVTDLYFQELGLKPSDRFIDLYQRISEHISESGDSLESIKAFLCDDVNGDGAYYCNYLTFVDGYRFVMRIVERSGQSVFLMLCSLTDSGGNELEQDKLSEASAALNRAIKSSLRKGDLYTRYSQNQFPYLLLGISLENCSIVSDRITSAQGIA